MFWRKKKEEKNPYLEEIGKAKEELELARQHLHFSDEAFEDSAIANYNAAVVKLNTLFKLAKEAESGEEQSENSK